MDQWEIEGYQWIEIWILLKIFSLTLSQVIQTNTKQTDMIKRNIETLKLKKKVVQVLAPRQQRSILGGNTGGDDTSASDTTRPTRNGNGG